MIAGLSQVLSYGKLGSPSKRTAYRPRAYYVHPQGNDQDDGTIRHPWRTLSRVNGVILIPGDSVLFQGGQSFSGTLMIDSPSGGNAQHPVLVGSYGPGAANILPGDSSAIVLRGAAHFSIRNLHLSGAGRKTGNIRPGMEISNARNITVQRLDISGFQKAGLLIYSSSDIQVLDVFAHENGAAGIEVGGPKGKTDCRNLYIARCRAEDNPGDPSNLTNHSGNGIVVGHSTQVTIEYCMATNNGWDMPRIGNGPVGIWAYESDQVTIQHCLSYRNKTSVGGADGGGFDLDGGVTHSVIQYCLSYENQGAGFCIFQYYYASPWHDNVFRYNISENDGSVSDAGGGLYVWNSSGDENLFYNCLVYNNTIYNAKAAALSYSTLSKRRHFSFYNNIFVGRDSLIKGERGVDEFRNNDWWSLTGTAKEIKAEKIPGMDLKPEFLDPGHTVLVSAQALKTFGHYRLPAKSPLLRGGLELNMPRTTTNPKTDFNGRSVANKGMGACF